MRIRTRKSRILGNQSHCRPHPFDAGKKPDPTQPPAQPGRAFYFSGSLVLFGSRQRGRRPSTPSRCQPGPAATGADNLSQVAVDPDQAVSMVQDRNVRPWRNSAGHWHCGACGRCSWRSASSTWCSRCSCFLAAAKSCLISCNSGKDIKCRADCES